MSKEGEDRIDPEEDIQFNSNTNSISISFIHSQQMKKKNPFLPCFLLAILSLTLRTILKADDKPRRVDFCPFSAAKGSVSASLPGSRIREPSRNRTPRPLRRLFDLREDPTTKTKRPKILQVRYNTCLQINSTFIFLRCVT